MNGFVEGEVFVPEKGTPIYKEWIGYSSKLASRINIPVSLVRACIISEAQKTLHKNAHIILLQEYRLSQITSHGLTREHLRKQIPGSLG